MPQKRRVVVLGIGNLLQKDDGVGVHAVRALGKSSLPEDIDLEIIDAGTSPDLLSLLDGDIDKLIIIDATQAHQRSGTLYRFTPDALGGSGEALMSLHDFGVRQNLELMKLTGRQPPRTIIIGVEPQEIGWGTELTPEIESKVPEIVAAVLREIAD